MKYILQKDLPGAKKGAVCEWNRVYGGYVVQTSLPSEKYDCIHFSKEAVENNTEWFLPNTSIPQEISVPDIIELVSLCKDYLTFVSGPNYHEDNDYKSYIYEKALTTFFGNKVFDFINSRT